MKAISFTNSVTKKGSNLATSANGTRITELCQTERNPYTEHVRNKEKYEFLHPAIGTEYETSWIYIVIVQNPH